MITAPEQWTKDVNDRVAATLAATRSAIAVAGPAAEDLMGAIDAASQGGKRLRALMVLASHDAHGGRERACALGVAAALELFQTAALLHDDVLDDSDTRRGQPAVHRVLAALHADHQWQGSSRDFGAAGGILAGDVALMACHRALHEALATVAPEVRLRAARLFTDMTEIVTAGQYLDMRIAAQPLSNIATQEHDIRTTMRTKTASYSAEFPLALGACLGGADDAGVAAVRAVGVPLGVAFQLRDDVLGVIGAPDVTGKPAGDDVREGKRTLLLHHTWVHGSDDYRAVLAAVVGNREASAEHVASVTSMMVDTGAVDHAEQEIESLATGALNALDALGLRDPGATLLAQIFTAATIRSS